jgi:spore germination cell wall hydrolase CwlJ-like protein
VKKAGRKYRPQRPVEQFDLDIPKRRSGAREYVPAGLGGLMLVLAFAFAGHYMGQNASAHNVEPGEALASLAMPPASTLIAKGSLLPDGATFDIINRQTLAKGSFAGSFGLGGESAVAKSDATFVIKDQPQVIAAKIVPASIDLQDSTAAPSQPVLLTPPVAKIEQGFRLRRSEVAKLANPANAKGGNLADAMVSVAPGQQEPKAVIIQHRFEQAEENCLARAVYFESRSESDLGQLAVAKVILNRVKDPAYPNTICGVVYQGSGSRNSCQFSFACDGLPDDVRSPTAWAHARMIAERAMSGEGYVPGLGNATNYHADYVNPRWSRTLRRMIKIGHHIFYSDNT